MISGACRRTQRGWPRTRNRYSFQWPACNDLSNMPHVSRIPWLPKTMLLALNVQTHKLVGEISLPNHYFFFCNCPLLLLFFCIQPLHSETLHAPLSTVCKYCGLLILSEDAFSKGCFNKEITQSSELKWCQAIRQTTRNTLLVMMLGVLDFEWGGARTGD